MELDQSIFTFFLKFNKKNKEKSLKKKKNQLNSVELVDIKESLCIFASAVFKLPIEIRGTQDFPYVSGNKIFLPNFIALTNEFEKNRLLYQVITLHLYSISKIVKSLDVAQDLAVELNNLEEFIISAKNNLTEAFPKYSELYSFVTEGWIFEINNNQFNEEVGFDRKIIWGRFPRKPNFISGSNEQAEPREALPEGATERKSKSKGSIKKIDFEEDKENIGQDVFHHFEKVETAEEYKGIQRDTDGADDLAAHADALDDLNLEQVIRTSKAAKSIYKTELDMGFDIVDLKEEEIVEVKDKVSFYDEWDEKNRIYKKDWCRVIQSKGIVGEKKLGKSHLDCLNIRNSEVNKLKKKLIQLTSEIKKEKRLYDGREIDIDNVIRNACLRRSGDPGDQRFYQETKKRHRDMACLLLVDTSLSSDSWVQNKRVLDVALEALLIFGEASASLGDPIMVAGFNSNTRHDCKFIQWKSFEEPWSEFKNQVDHIVPTGYTRIGPAIRHANKLLSERSERHKLLLIFTDGRPTDFDKYEGHYGLSDVRQAIRESDRLGVVSFALAIDLSAKQFLPRLFGLGNYQILTNMELLPVILAKFYTKMVKTK